MLENIRSVHNVGSVFRTGDGFGVSRIFLSGYTPCPPRKDLKKTALGADEVVPWSHYEYSEDVIDYLEEQKHVGNEHYVNAGIDLEINDHNKLSFATTIQFYNINFATTNPF